MQSLQTARFDAMGQLPVAQVVFYWLCDIAKWYKPNVMKSLRFMPLTFIAGAHGFPMFVSYLAVVIAVMQISRLVRS
jgi:hypothetical protein